MRRPMDAAERARRQTEIVAAEVATWSMRKTPEPKKKRQHGWNKSEAQQALDEMIATRVWALARPQHFVELYARLHEQVYGVPPLELATNKPKMAAASLASRALKQYFNDDAEALADFMRWVWQRQAITERKRKAGTSDTDFRVTWRYQWSARLITDYRRVEITR